jgi:phage shock protein PspC (stress-responsive transcriptional regulator)
MIRAFVLFIFIIGVAAIIIWWLTMGRKLSLKAILGLCSRKGNNRASNWYVFIDSLLDGFHRIYVIYFCPAGTNWGITKKTMKSSQKLMKNVEDETAGVGCRRKWYVVLWHPYLLGVKQYIIESLHLPDKSL